MPFRLVWFSIGYFVLVALTTSQFGSNPPLRLANALALFLLLREPLRRWPVVAVLVLLAGFLGRQASGTAEPVLAGIINTTEVLLIAGLVRGTGGLGSPWYLTRPLLRLTLACLLVPAATALLGATWVDHGPEPLPVRWLTWYLASVLGKCIVIPLLLSWGSPQLRERTVGRRAWMVAGALLPAAAGVVLLLQPAYPALVALTFPLVLMATWHHGLAGATAALTIVGAAGTWTAWQDTGALGELLLEESLAQRVQAAQVYLLALTLTTLPFAVLRARREQLMADLRRSSEARSEFLAAMSHEIRTPMTGVLGVADVLAQETLTPPQRALVDSLRVSGRHLLDVINDILDFSRIESGRLTLERVPFAPTAVVEQLRSLMNPLAIERGLTLEIVLPTEPVPSVWGDPTRLRQILLNLVGNAVKFTPSGYVRVRVEARLAPPDRLGLRFEVEDTGIGMTPEQLGRIFDDFSQADRSTARRYGGSGLGLSISKRLAEAMGGRIEVSSEPGKGSLFALQLELPAANDAEVPADTGMPLSFGAPRRILVAEDVKVNRDILRAVLERHGHRLVFAENGAEALARVQEQPFDLVLMDVQMPVLDGEEATRRIRALAGPVARVPIIGLTANVMAQEQERYLGAGMERCLPKPIDWQQLAAALAACEAVAPIPIGGEVADAGGAEPPQSGIALLDAVQLGTLVSMIGKAELSAMFAVGRDSLEEAIARMRSAGDPQLTGREAHRVKGSAGTLGWARVSAVAAAIEQACEDGMDASPLVDQLVSAAEATMDELVRTGRMPRSSIRAVASES